MKDPELKKILEEHTTQETKDKIAGIDRNEKSYWDKLQMGMIIAAIAIAVVAIIILAVYLYKRHKKKKAQKKAEQLLQGQGNSPVQAKPVNWQQYQQITSNNQQPNYNLHSMEQAQGQLR